MLASVRIKHDGTCNHDQGQTFSTTPAQRAGLAHSLAPAPAGSAGKGLYPLPAAIQPAHHRTLGGHRAAGSRSRLLCRAPDQQLADRADLAPAPDLADSGGPALVADPHRLVSARDTAGEIGRASC